MGALKNLLLECQGVVRQVLHECPDLAEDNLQDIVGTSDSGVDGLTWEEVGLGIVDAAIEAELNGHLK
jgi:hypothetical protein